jgi:hypothetical protein
LDAIEQAIRNAFAKGNPEDPAFRERVYRSANAALERALLANASIPADLADRRRKGILATITSIESEFVPAVDPVAPAAPSAAPPVSPPVPEPAAASPVFDGPAGQIPEAPPPVDVPAAPGPAPDRREPDWSMPTVDRPVLAGEARSPVDTPASGQLVGDAPKRQRGRWGFVAGLLSLLIILGLAVWAAVEFGVVGPSGGGSRQPSAAVPQPGTGADGAPLKPGEQEALENWVMVFSPDDPTSVAAAAGARAEVVEAGGEKALRIASRSGGASVRFDVGQGILEQIAGKRAVFDIIARTGDGPETQMSVACDFGALGDCGRNRYIVGAQRSEFLFEVEVPAGVPDGAGQIEVVPDVENAGKAVEIIQIRVSATSP